jgi:hypothetical protein
MAKGLTYLGTCLSHKDRAAVITVVLPRDSWTALWYEASKQRTALSEQHGHGGVLVECQPPEGESYASGFWFSGCWVKCGGDSRPQNDTAP